MKLSTRAKYGLKALIDLGLYSEKEAVSLQSIAGRQNISVSYLEQLMALLKKAGLVKSVRGAAGGYFLGRPAEEISVGDILRVLEGGLEAATCPGTEGDGGCQGSDLCVAKLVWKRINDSITDAVDTLMLSELIEESRRIHEKYYPEQEEKKMGKMIYLDNAATTKTAPEVVEAMLPYFTEFYGNASTVYDFAANSKAAIAKARQQIADVIGAKKEEIYFTAGGSESDNWALKATFEAYKAKGNHIITTKIEHHAILHTCEYLEKERGAKVTYLDVDENGFIDLDELQKAITPETILISVMAANNEIGTLEPLKEIGQIAHEHGILFHTDAVQAFGQIPINVDEFNIDMLSSSGHKINGPKGIGFLYIRKGVKIRSFVHGGAQERKRRAGTENVPGIVGYGLAAERANKSMKERTAKEIEIRDHMISRILTEIPYVRLNGDKVKRLPNNVNVSIQFIEGESLLLMLDNFGICASSGSACTSGSLDPSHVLLAIGLPHEIAHGSLRMTLSEETTMEDVDFVVDKLKDITANLRSMSPLYEDFIKKQKNNKILARRKNNV